MVARWYNRDDRASSASAEGMCGTAVAPLPQARTRQPWGFTVTGEWLPDACLLTPSGARYAGVWNL